MPVLRVDIKRIRSGLCRFYRYLKTFGLAEWITAISGVVTIISLPIVIVQLGDLKKSQYNRTVQLLSLKENGQNSDKLSQHGITRKQAHVL